MFLIWTLEGILQAYDIECLEKVSEVWIFGFQQQKGIYIPRARTNRTKIHGSIYYQSMVKSGVLISKSPMGCAGCRGTTWQRKVVSAEDLHVCTSWSAIV